MTGVLKSCNGKKIKLLGFSKTLVKKIDSDVIWLWMLQCLYTTKFSKCHKAGVPTHFKYFTQTLKSERGNWSPLSFVKWRYLFYLLVDSYQLNVMLILLMLLNRCNDNVPLLQQHLNWLTCKLLTLLYMKGTLVFV